MAAEKASGRQIERYKKGMLLKTFVGILGTGRVKPTTCTRPGKEFQKGREEELIGAYKEEGDSGKESVQAAQQRLGNEAGTGHGGFL